MKSENQELELEGEKEDEITALQKKADDSEGVKDVEKAEKEANKEEGEKKSLEAKKEEEEKKEKVEKKKK